MFDYEDGEADWVAYGLPTEGSRAHQPRAGRVVHRDAPTCGLAERIGAVRDRLAGSGWEQCVVVDAAGIVHGRVDADVLSADPETTVEAVMQAGPATVRPSEALAELVERMVAHDVATMIVTTSDGRFVGVLRRTEAEQVLTLDRRGAGTPRPQ